MRHLNEEEAKQGVRFRVGVAKVRSEFLGTLSPRAFSLTPRTWISLVSVLVVEVGRGLKEMRDQKQDQGLGRWGRGGDEKLQMGKSRRGRGEEEEVEMGKEGVGGEVAAAFLHSLWLGVGTWCSLWVLSDTGAPANCPLAGKKKRVHEPSAGQGTVNCPSVTCAPVRHLCLLPSAPWSPWFGYKGYLPQASSYENPTPPPEPPASWGSGSPSFLR